MLHLSRCIQDVTCQPTDGAGVHGCECDLAVKVKSSYPCLLEKFDVLLSGLTWPAGYGKAGTDCSSSTCLCKGQIGPVCDAVLMGKANEYVVSNHGSLMTGHDNSCQNCMAAGIYCAPL